jgi:dTDP-4-dehydrorhamnose 3,5-epimerase
VTFEPTGVAGVVLVIPDVHRDARGFFVETYHATRYAAGGIDGVFVQDNHSRSERGTLRGLHLQVARPQGKLVRAASGAIWDVAVDLRPGSPTFRQWTAAVLSADNFHQLYVPPGCAHGFCVTSDIADVHYKCTELYDRADETGLAYDDPALGIAWPAAAPILSDRDRHQAGLEALLSTLSSRADAHSVYTGRIGR